MDTIFRKHRKKQGEVWQLGWYQSPFWTAPAEGGPPFRPGTVVCLSLRTRWRQSSPPGPGEPGPEVFREVVTQAARVWRFRPERIQVCDARIAEDLGNLLAREDVAVQARHDLPELRAMLEQETAEIRDAMPPPALSVPGITVERMAAFARAAGRFGEAAPWRHLSMDDILGLEAEGLPEELRSAQVIGAPGSTGTILFHPHPAENFMDSIHWEDEEPDSEEEDGWMADSSETEAGLWQVSLFPPSLIPPEDVELWMEQDLALIHPRAYPLAFRASGDGAERPDARLLSWFEAILSALASTTEEEMDTGRWEKEVAAFDGPVRLVLSLPGVLEPLDLELFPRAENDDRPEPERLADEISWEAAESSGRRQIHLARQAIALWPDCVDAWLLLAERALDPESARDLYARAVAAGDRLMFPDGEESLSVMAGGFPIFPWIWARTGLAKSLWSLGKREEALGHLQRVLEVDPDDHERVRYLLIHALLALGRNDEAADLLTRFPEETSDWRYTRALLTFRLEGDSPAARRQIAAAFQADRGVAQQLLGIIKPGSYDESHAVLFRDVWEETPEALEALRSQSAASTAARTRKTKGKVEKKKRKRRYR